LLDDLERRDRGLVVAQAEAHDTLGISAVLDTDERVIGEVEAVKSSDSHLFGMRKVVDLAAGKIDDRNSHGIVGNEKAFAILGEDWGLRREKARQQFCRPWQFAGLRARGRPRRRGCR
jgi:hypothetical protein